MAFLKNNKIGLAFCAIAATTLISCSESPAPSIVDQANTLTSAEKAAGWQLLFDGKSISHWKRFNADGVPAAWKAKDGALAFSKMTDAADNGDIISKDIYDNFELKLEWKISTGGNSGIFYYIVEGQEYKKPWLTGIEMQVIDNDVHKDAEIITHRAGDLYDLIAGVPETVKPVGEWNTVKIVSKNGNLEQWLNGQKIVETKLWDDNWREMVANSKFSRMPSFGIFKQGHIGLQDHGDDVWFRNIKILKID